MSTIRVTNLKHESSSSDNITLTSGGATQIGGLTYPTSDGTNGQYLQTNGSGALSWQAATRYARSGPVTLTNQSTVEFTGIPDWAEFFVVTFRGVSVSTTNDVEIQVGDADAWITTGYQTGAANNTGGAKQGKTTSFFFNDIPDNEALSGRMVFQKDSDSNGLVMNGSVASGTVGGLQFAGGHLVHTDLVVTRVRLTIASGNYDSGVINLYYHG